MVDVHSPKQRSRNMAAIKGKNTKPELVIRKELHRLGFRYRIHYSALPGKPDLVFPKYKAVIQIHGCFWHKCPKCFNKPKTNKKYWLPKIENNVKRDRKNSRILKKEGYKVIRIWEHEIKKDFYKVLTKIVE